MMELETRDASTAGIDFVSVSNSDRQLESIAKRIDALAARGERLMGMGATMIGAGLLALVLSGIGIFAYAHDVKGSLRIINLPGYVVRDSGIEYSQDYAGVAGRYLSAMQDQLNACKSGKAAHEVSTTAAEVAIAAGAAAAEKAPDNPQKPGPMVATENCTVLQNGYVYMRAQAVMLEAPNAARDHGASFISDVAWLKKHQDDADFGFVPEADTMEQLGKRAAWMTANGGKKQPATAGQTWSRFIKNLIAPAFLLGGVFLGYGWLLGKRTRRLQRQMKKLAKA
jgi:hypothetical protein